MEKLDINKLGFDGRKKQTAFAVLQVAKKVNEIVEWINAHKDQLLER